MKYLKLFVLFIAFLGSAFVLFLLVMNKSITVTNPTYESIYVTNMTIFDSDQLQSIELSNLIPADQKTVIQMGFITNVSLPTQLSFISDDQYRVVSTLKRGGSAYKLRQGLRNEIYFTINQ